MIIEKTKNLCIVLRKLGENLRQIEKRIAGPRPAFDKELDVDRLCEEAARLLERVEALKEKVLLYQSQAGFDLSRFSEDAHYLSVYMKTASDQLDAICSGLDYGDRAGDETAYHDLAMELWVVDKNLNLSTQYLNKMEAKFGKSGT